MSFYVFENLYGEKPHRDETKRNRDVAVNSYTYLIKTSIQNYQKTIHISVIYKYMDCHILFMCLSINIFKFCLGIEYLLAAVQSKVS